MSEQYLEDIPAAKPRFDFDKVGAALASVLLRPARGAVVLGLHAPWGGGKTTLLNAIRDALRAKERAAVATNPANSDIYIEFNAWKFQEREALWRALILHVLEQLKACGADEKKIKELQQSLYRTFAVEEKGPWKMDWRGLILEVIGLALSIVKLDFIADAVRKSTGFLGRLFVGSKKKDDGGDEDAVLDKERIEKFASFLERETVQRQVLQIESIEQFLDEFRELIDQLRRGEDGKLNRRIYVFIDDLDRCLPEDALTIFESIKLFLDANGCCYIIALDRDVIRKGLDMRYSRQGEAAAGQAFIDPDEYIEKTISISYDLPVLTPEDMGILIDDFSLPSSLSKDNKDLIARGLGNNPRRMIRFMNALAVQMQLASASGSSEILNPADARFSLFLKMQLINYRYPALFARVGEDPDLLARVQKIANAYNNAKDKVDGRKKRKESLEEEPKAVRALAYNEEFWRLMMLPPAIPDATEQIRRVAAWFRYKPKP
jgi:hypothetical protein